jgi:hypothetical protein
VASHEFVVGAELDQLAAFQHRVQVGHSDRREAVRDQECDCPVAGSDAPGCRGISSEDLVLGLRVEGGAGLVKNH